MQPKALIVVLLVTAVAATGCIRAAETIPAPPQGGAAPGGQSAPPPSGEVYPPGSSAAPGDGAGSREVLNETYTFGATPPGAATFDVPAGFRQVDVVLTGEGSPCIAAQIRVTLTSPDGDSDTVDLGNDAGAMCSLGGDVTLPAAEGAWTLAFEGTGTIMLRAVGTAR